MNNYSIFKTFVFDKLRKSIQNDIKESLQDKFINNTFTIQRIGEQLNNIIVLYGEELTKDSSSVYEFQEWFISQGCKNEDILILITNLTDK
jgi:hypothetical protein